MNTKNVNRLFKQTIYINSILFLIVILLTAQISFSKVLDVLYDEVTVANQTILYQTQHSIDLQLYNIDTKVEKLSKERSVTFFVSKSEPTIHEKFEVLNTLKNTYNDTGIISNIGIYSTVSKSMFSIKNQTTSLPDYLSDSINNALATGNSAWHEFAESGMRDITYIAPLSNKKGAVIVNVSESILYEAIRKYRAEENGIFFVVSNSGTTLSHNNKAYILTNVSDEGFFNKILNSTEKEGFFWADYYGKHSLITYSNSTYTGWTYANAIPDKFFSDRINRSKLQIYIIALLIFLASITLAYILVKKIYTPVDKFVHSLAESITKNHPSDSIKRDFGTFDELEVTFSNLMEHHNSMQTEYDKRARALSWNIIMNMLLGFDTNYDNFIPSLETTNVHLYPKNFVVLLMDIMPIENSHSENDEREIILTYNVLKAKLETLINIETKGCVNTVGNHGAIAIVSFEDNSEPENMSLLLSLINELMEFSKKYFNYRMYISIGRFYENVSELHKSYTEAACAMKYKSISIDSSIFMIDDYLLNIEDNETLSGTSSIIDEFVKDFKDYNSTELSSNIARITDIMQNEDIAFILRKQLALQTVMLIVTQHIRPIERYSGEAVSLKYLNSNQLIDSCSDGASLSETLVKLLHDIHSAYNDNNNIGVLSSSLSAQAIEYIDNHYMDSSTSLSSVAAYLNVSDSHLSRIFKSSTGKRFMEYLIYRRIEKAKELLLSNKYRVNDIAQLVGYDNQTSFLKIFKKYTGLTPSEFKSAHSEG